MTPNPAEKILIKEWEDTLFINRHYRDMVTGEEFIEREPRPFIPYEILSTG